jgi:hypothetical protein
MEIDMAHQTTMTTEQKGKMIGQIISHMKFHARQNKKFFDEGDTFFALAFKTDAELKNIARLAGI